MSEIEVSDIHSRLREARMKAGFSSASKAAEKLGFPVSTYLSHENGNRAYQAEQAARYGRVFKVSPNWLLFGQCNGEVFSTAVDGADRVRRAVFGAFAAVEAMGKPVTAENISEAASRLYDLDDH